jgi:hypothetical protein
MLRFTIRDLLWLMVVVGLAVGWWLEYRKFSLEEKAALEIARTMMKNQPLPND